MGLATRSRPQAFPALVATYGGDVLYAVLWVQIVAVVARGRVAVCAGIALAVCVAIEASQAVHLGWLDALRATRAGALVLGRGFMTSDLACYAVGAGFGAAVERGLRALGA